MKRLGHRHGRARVVTFVSGKGGVGKTVLVANLGFLLARSGYRVLLIDWDFFTRGLTFFMLQHGSGESRGPGVLEIVIEKGTLDDLQPYPIIRPKNGSQYEAELDLISSVSVATTALEFSDVVALSNRLTSRGLRQLAQLLEDLVSKYGSVYDYILVDTRSGAELLGLVPVFFSDSYVMISEEDRTSWRVSLLLQDALDVYKKSLGRHLPEDRGFIINGTVIPFTRTMKTFLEKDVFLNIPLWGIIPFEEKVKAAYARDLIVVDEYPRTEFSIRLSQIARERLAAEEVTLPRLTMLQMLSRRKELIALSALAYIAVLLTFLGISDLFDVRYFLPIFIALLSVLAAASLSFWFRSRQEY